MEFMAADGIQIAVLGAKGYLQIPLHTIHVEQGARGFGPHKPADGWDVVDGPHLVVYLHDGHQQGIRGQELFQAVQVNAALPIHPGDLHIILPG